MEAGGGRYQHLFESCGRIATVLHHPQNTGKGRAIKTGLAYIAEHYDENTVIVTVDADGQHKAEDALAICRLAEKEPATLVLGSRRLKGDIPLRSRFGNAMTRLVYMLATGKRVHDTQTGLRAFDASLLPTLLEIEGERYEYEMNMLLHFARQRIGMREHEIETIYIDDNAASHFNPFKDSLRIYKEIIKFSMSSFVGFLTDYAVYSLLVLSGVHLRLANVLARVVSATVNFTVNRKFVFHSKETLWRAAVKYFLLAAAILVGNTVVLELLVRRCGIDQMIAKIITEVLFFLLSWLTQRLVVFKKKTDREG